MEIRLIAADMDGTLLDDEKGIPEENLRAFRACAAQGIEIVPATGRTMRGASESAGRTLCDPHERGTGGRPCEKRDHRLLPDPGGSGRKDHDDGPDKFG